MDDLGRDARLIALLEDRVRVEARGMDGMLGLGLSDEIIDRLTEGVTAGVLAGFSVDWAPKWVPKGEVHAWEESGAWFARCGTCLLDSPASSSRKAALHLGA